MNSEHADVHAAASAPVTQNGGSVTTAVEHMLAAGQQVITNRIDLLRLDLLDALWRTLRGVALLSIGVLLVCGGWFTAMTWLLAASENYASLPARLGFITLLNVGIGAASLAVGIRMMRRGSVSQEGTDRE